MSCYMCGAIPKEMTHEDWEAIGYKKAITEVRAELTILEHECLDHTENEYGEWETMTISYDMWADVWSKLEQLKEQRDE